MCTSDYTDIAVATPTSKPNFGTCIDSGASNDYSPDWSKFSNYREIDRDITTADGYTIKVRGIGDRKLGHISSAAIRHAVSKGFITRIALDNESKPEFCEACAKAKSVCQPFPKESQNRAEKYGDHVHWDLWGPAAVKSINRNYYVAARINDATCETRLYFQEKKSQTFNSYKKDEAYIQTQTRNKIKIVCSDWGGEFLSKKFTKYQDTHGTIWQLTIHDSPPQNGVAERGMRTHMECTDALYKAYSPIE